MLLASHRASGRPTPGSARGRARTQRCSCRADATTDPSARAHRRAGARSGLACQRGGSGGRGPRVHGGRGRFDNGGRRVDSGRHMNAMVWRLHRNQVWFALGALTLVAVLLLVTGTVMAHEYRSALASCQATPELWGPGRSALPGRRRHSDLVDLTIVVPLLFGLFWGAPLLSKEFEDDTHSWAWTQGVSRRAVGARQHRMVIARRRAVGRGSGGTGQLLALPENALYSRFQAFDVQGIVPVAYAIFAVSLGIAVGSVVRRVLPSLAVTLGLFVGLRTLVGRVSPPALHVPHHQAVPAGRAGFLTTRSLGPRDQLRERPRTESRGRIFRSRRCRRSAAPHS